MIKTYEEIHKDLKHGLCQVKFTKINGDERDMTCTLDFGIIPVEDRPTGNGSTVTNNETMRVYDTNAKGWRSFRLDSIIEFTHK